MAHRPGESWSVPTATTSAFSESLPHKRPSHYERVPSDFQPLDVDPNSTVRPSNYLNTTRAAPTPWLSLVFFVDLILTFLPLVFIVLAFAALSVDNEPLSRKGHVVEVAAKLGPSIFPILFAAVVGRLMRTLALWRAERGTSLGLLEQLNGSQNLLAAFERAALIQG